MLKCKFKLILKKGYNINYSLKSRLYERAITSNRELPCHGEFLSQMGTNHSSGAERSIRKKFD